MYFNTVHIFSHVQRSETVSLSSRTKNLEKELGAIRTRIQNMEKEIHGSIQKGTLATRLDKLQTDTFS